nr:hypothetical protein [Pedobacter sp. ASV2]
MRKIILLSSIIWTCLLCNVKAQVTGSGGTYFNVLKVSALDSAPNYFYVNTNIPATDVSAPQIQITGYMYNATNHALKITLGWYHYAGNFYWTQFQSDFGYQKPSRVRLGKYTKNGSEFIRIEISNNAVYWSNYTFSATDRAELSSYYQGWTYAEGEMPAETTNQITVVGQPVSTSIEGNLGIGISNPAERLAVNGNIRAKEVKVEATGWPDYVFKKDYPLLSLEATEKHIKEKGYLPGMPSAKEVELNGLELGEMNKRLLQKVEELTLHLIAEKRYSNQAINKLNAKLSEQNIRLKSLERKNKH